MIWGIIFVIVVICAILDQRNFERDAYLDNPRDNEEEEQW